jgi:hypothetical protein
MKESVDSQTASVPDGPASREEILMPFTETSVHTCWKYTVALEQMRRREAAPQKAPAAPPLKSAFRRPAAGKAAGKPIYCSWASYLS